MTPIAAKEALTNSIQALTDYKWFFSSRPGKDFSRNRKLSFEKMIYGILGLSNKTLNQELQDFFNFDPALPTSSAFIQQRAKLVPETFETLFHFFTGRIRPDASQIEFPFLAVDGSDLQIAANPNDPDSYFPGTNGQKHYNLLHINAMYDLYNHLYVDALVQKRRNFDESGALTAMVDRSIIPRALLIADRGYESYNNLAHIQEKGWNYLIRIRDGNHGIGSGLNLPCEDEFDVPFSLNLVRKQTNEAKELLKDRNHFRFIASSTRFDYLPAKSRKHAPFVFYTLPFRIVRFRISDSTFETIITNLDQESFPASEIKKIYAMRWGIETSFRELKYTLGLLHLHAKKVEFVLQEIFAKLIMYNFCEVITQSVVIQQGIRKHAYKVSFPDAVHICLHFFRGNVSPPNVEALLLMYVSPIRPGRKDTRKLSPKPSVSFIYRVA